MTGIAAIDTKSYTNFACTVAVGGRSAIRLLNSACGWAKEIAGKTNFAFLGCELDTAVLSQSFLKPLDNQIYVVKASAAWIDFKKKCWNDVKRDDVGTILRATQHAFKTIGDSAAALRCLATFGLVILAPYRVVLGLTKNSFAVTAGVLEIMCRVHHLATKVINQPVKTEEDQRRQQLEWTADMLMIITQIFSIQLNFFGGCQSAFGGAMRPGCDIPEAVFNFWGTNASLAALGYAAVDYIKGPPAQE